MVLLINQKEETCCCQFLSYFLQSNSKGSFICTTLPLLLIGKEGRKCFIQRRTQHILYGVGHMAKDHSDSKRGNPLPPHGLLFPINSKGSFICTIPQTLLHTRLCYTSRGALAGTRNSSKGPPHEGSVRQPITP